MNNIIVVKPNKDGKLFITLFGTKYQIVVETPTAPKLNKSEKIED